MERYFVIKTTMLENGQMKSVTVKDKDLLVARVDNNYYVADARCPHLGGRLPQGKLSGTVVTCPRHGSKFDLRDGRVIQWTNQSGIVSKLSQTLKSPRSLNTYSSIIEGENIYVEL